MKSVGTIVFGLFVLFGTLSCSNGEELLEVSIQGDESYLIPDTYKTCLAQYEGSEDDISKSFVEFPGVTLNWKDTKKNFYLVTIVISVPTNSSGTETSCVLPAAEIQALSSVWDQYDVAVLGLAEVTAPSGTKFTPGAELSLRCSLRCGGITLPSGFQSSATIDFVGYSISSGGTKTPVRATKYVTVSNIL